MLLKQGMENTEVANWQRFLISRGFKLDADGDFGRATFDATKAFQASQNLTADGIVGDATLAAAQKLDVSKVGSVKVNNSVAVRSSEKDEKLLEGIHPGLAMKVRQLIALAAHDGYTLKIAQGLRTFAEQDALFRKRPVVTHARGGQSYHNYGVACDFVFIVNGKATYEPESLYHNIGRWAESVGLEWGGSWRTFTDLPHVQLKGLPSYKVLLPVYKSGGLEAVWSKY